MTKLPPHLQKHIDAHEAKMKEFFGYTTQEQAEKLQKTLDKCDAFHPIHAMAKF